MKKNKFKDTFVTKKGESIDMDIEEIARWCCLVEAVDIISTKGSQIGMDMDKQNWVKPIAIQKYIDERHDTMIEEIERDQSNLPVTIY